jgi:hypothetical protein
VTVDAPPAPADAKAGAWAARAAHQEAAQAAKVAREAAVLADADVGVATQRLTFEEGDMPGDDEILAAAAALETARARAAERGAEHGATVRRAAELQVQARAAAEAVRAASQSPRSVRVRSGNIRPVSPARHRIVEVTLTEAGPLGVTLWGDDGAAGPPQVEAIEPGGQMAGHAEVGVGMTVVAINGRFVSTYASCLRVRKTPSWPRIWANFSLL